MCDLRAPLTCTLFQASLDGRLRRQRSTGGTQGSDERGEAEARIDRPITALSGSDVDSS